MYSVCLKRDSTFTEREEDRVYLLLEIYFPETYPTVEDNNILPFILITDRRRRKENWELAKEVWKLDGNLKPLKLLGVKLLQSGLEIILGSVLMVVRDSIALRYIPRA